MSNENRHLVKVNLPNGEQIKVEVTQLSAERDVRGGDVFEFKDFPKKLEAIIVGVAGGVKEALKTVEPTKVAIEFGVEVGIESGQLTTILVKGTGTANLKVTAEWGSSK